MDFSARCRTLPAGGPDRHNQLRRFYRGTAGVSHRTRGQTEKFRCQPPPIVGLPDRRHNHFYGHGHKRRLLRRPDHVLCPQAYLDEGDETMKYSSGFSLIELLITVSIIGILSSLALISYTDNVIAANRTEGRSALQTAAGTLEKCRSL